MANPRSAWGIDVGNRALKAIKLVRDPSGTLRVDDFEIIEHETLLSTAGDNRDSLIQSAVAHFIQKHPVKGAAAAVSVSGSNSLARFIKLPPVEPKKIPEIVRFEAIQQIPFPLDDVEWSYQLFQSPDSPDVEVGIFAMRKELINHHLQFFTDVGLRIEAVQLNPLAVYNAMAYDDRLKGPTMMIDLGSENTDLIIADGETIWLRSIPIGGKNFTEILVKQFKLSFPKAEELKRTAATSKYAKQIFQAMRPVFADLVAEVQRSIGFYASVHRDSRIKKVIALGGTFRLPGLQKYLQQNLQLEVTRIDALAGGGPAEARARTVFDENLLSLASAYGLAIQAMGDAKISSSLLPEHIRREKLWKDKTPMFAAAAAMFVLGTGVAMGSYFWQKVQVDQAQQNYQSSISGILNTGQSLDKKWASNVEREGAGDRQRIANLRAMCYYRDLWPGLLSDIYASMPLPANPLLLSGKWDDIKAKIPRKDRDILLIDEISNVYDPDLAKTVAAATGDNGGSGGASNLYLPNLQPNVVPGGSHGFFVTINLVTPYGGGVVDALKFVNSSFLKNLRERDQKDKAGKEYSVVYAQVTRQRKLGEDDAYKAKLLARETQWQSARTLYSPPPPAQTGGAPAPNGGAPAVGGRPGQGMFGGPAPVPIRPSRPGFEPGGRAPAPTPVYGMPAAGTPAAQQPYLDPNTGEDMTSDTVLQVTAIVVINDPDAPKAATK